MKILVVSILITLLTFGNTFFLSTFSRKLISIMFKMFESGFSLKIYRALESNIHSDILVLIRLSFK
jgi:hypothetical protein